MIEKGQNSCAVPEVAKPLNLRTLADRIPVPVMKFPSNAGQEHNGSGDVGEHSLNSGGSEVAAGAQSVPLRSEGKEHEDSRGKWSETKNDVGWSTKLK